MIIIKTDKEIEIMRQGGRILASILKKLVKEIKPGVTTGHLEKVACSLIRDARARPSFKGFKSIHDSRAFPTALCTSINNEIVHAPSLPSRKLKSGDIVGIDLGMEYPYSKNIHGYYTDMAVTIPVGKTSKETRKLIDVTKKSLILAIKQVKPGNSINNIGRTIQQYVEKEGFSVVRDLVGHGVGTAVHEEPQVPNYEVTDSKRLKKITLKPGMALAIEPMVNTGGWKVKNGDDGFTILTADGNLSAHFEHTVVVTKKGHEVITKI